MPTDGTQSIRLDRVQHLFRRFSCRCAIRFPACIHCCSHACGLVADKALAPLHEFFPLRPPAVNNFAATVYIVAELFLASVHDGADLLCSLLAFCTQIFRPLARALSNVFPGFASALGCIQFPPETKRALASCYPLPYSKSPFKQESLSNQFPWYASNFKPHCKLLTMQWNTGAKFRAC
jgi:hypothetical protein